MEFSMTSNSAAPGSAKRAKAPVATSPMTLSLPNPVREQVERAALEAGQTAEHFILAATAHAIEATESKDALALLLDLDSFAGRPPVNIDAIERAASAVGHVCIRRSFSTAGEAELAESKARLHSRNYRHEECPSRESLRLRLAGTALEASLTRRVSAFAIVTADPDIRHAVSMLREQNTRVMGIGVELDAKLPSEFVLAFDDYRMYDYVDRPPETEVLRALRSKCVGQLVQAVYRIESRGAKAVLAAVIPALRHWNPEASPELLEYKNWRDLADQAKSDGLVEVTESGLDWALHLTDLGRRRAKELIEKSEAAESRGDQIERAKRAIVEILKIDLLEASARFLIFNTAQWVIQEEMTKDGIALVDLSHRVASRLTQSGVQQNSVYRLLNGLYRAGVFEFAQNTENEYDPRILYSRISVMDFDLAFSMNLLRAVLKKHPEIGASEAACGYLSEVLYGSVAQSRRVSTMIQIANDAKLSRRPIAELMHVLAEARNGQR
jgi:hypothetical protein